MLRDGGLGRFERELVAGEGLAFTVEEKADDFDTARIGQGLHHIGERDRAEIGVTVFFHLHKQYNPKSLFDNHRIKI